MYMQSCDKSLALSATFDSSLRNLFFSQLAVASHFLLSNVLVLFDRGIEPAPNSDLDGQVNNAVCPEHVEVDHVRVESLQEMLLEGRPAEVEAVEGELGEQEHPGGQQSKQPSRVGCAQS